MSLKGVVRLADTKTCQNTNCVHNSRDVLFTISATRMETYSVIHYVDKIIKRCCYVIRSTRSPPGSPRPPGWPATAEPAVGAPGQPGCGLPEGDLVDASCNYTVLFLSLDVKNTKFNQYLPVDLTSLNVSNSRFRKPVMFWRWRRHGVALWRHGRDAWHNCLLLATGSNVKSCPITG